MKCWIQHEHPSIINQTAIKMTNISSGWAINQNYVAIRSITASFQQGNLSAIIGPVGSGNVRVLSLKHRDPSSRVRR